jgi:hypothetical protein
VCENPAHQSGGLFARTPTRTSCATARRPPRRPPQARQPAPLRARPRRRDPSTVLLADATEVRPVLGSGHPRSAQRDGHPLEFPRSRGLRAPYRVSGACMSAAWSAYLQRNSHHLRQP